jgi:hypothetical protein
VRDLTSGTRKPNAGCFVVAIPDTKPDTKPDTIGNTEPNFKPIALG